MVVWFFIVLIYHYKIQHSDFLMLGSHGRFKLEITAEEVVLVRNNTWLLIHYLFPRAVEI